jgi:hypothetical protein
MCRTHIRSTESATTMVVMPLCLRMHYPGTDHCASPQGHISHPPHGPLKTIAAKADRMNYTTMEDIPEDEQVIIESSTLCYKNTNDFH